MVRPPSSDAKNIATDLSTSNVLLGDLSPMIQHYVETKRRLTRSLCNGSTRRLLLMYRVGDFFESFFEDACLLASTCSIALTSKDAGKALGARIPMAGVPHHAADSKIRILLRHDITIAVVDQVQPASQVAAGALVRRAVTRLITPATVCEEAFLDSRQSVYLAALVLHLPAARPSCSHHINMDTLKFGFAYADVSTGEFKVTDGVGLDSIQRLLVGVAPSELLLVTGPGQTEVSARVRDEVRRAGTSVVTERDAIEARIAEETLVEFHGIDDVESIGCRGRLSCIEAAASLLIFMRHALAVDESLGKPLPLNALKTFGLDDVMLLDAACLRNMEVMETNRDRSVERSLQWAVDRTVTSMGARCLRMWLLAPSLRLDIIKCRQVIVRALLEDCEGTREEIQSMLRGICDLERLSGRVGAGRASPRDLRILAESILQLPPILNSMQVCLGLQDANELPVKLISDLLGRVSEDLLSIAQEVDAALVDPAPSSLLLEMMVRSDSLSKDNLDPHAVQIFRPGYSKELDTKRRAIDNPSTWVAALESQEQRRSGIDSIRIKHIKNTGYVLRIPRSIAERKMGEDNTIFARLGYERVQSTKAEVRFRFDELVKHERVHSSAFSEIVLLELRLFEGLQSKLSQHVPYVRALGQRIASIDVLCGFAQVAEEQDYVEPKVLDLPARVLELEDARHPVVEQTLYAGKTFVPNSFQLGAAQSRSFPDLMVLCGPNAAGKSCALRSVGLICILAQIGSFVPAKSATMSLCDRIFTRVGAVDDLARGQSTFQVEMAETACILSHATSSSLVLLDEIGRGTSTVDGISIAWSVSEQLARSRGEDGEAILPPRTIFVTHYHELNQLAVLHSNIKSFGLHMERRETVDAQGRESVEWITTHKVVPGASFESLGLAVAKRAGFPVAVVERAEEIARLLHAPSKALGAELSKALSSHPGKEADLVEAKHGADQGSDHDVMELVESSGSSASCAYDEGYRAGYERATAELYKELGNFMRRIQPESGAA